MTLPTLQPGRVMDACSGNPLADAAAWAQDECKALVGNRVAQFLNECLPRCESPLEIAFLAALAPHVVLSGIWVGQQVPFGPYRADFVLRYFDFDEDKRYELVVEVDGHAFHSRTREQATKDRRRDRFFTSQDIRFLRFTSTEVFADARKCGIEAIRVLRERETIKESAA